MNVSGRSKMKTMHFSPRSVDKLLLRCAPDPWMWSVTSAEAPSREAVQQKYFTTKHLGWGA